MPNQVEIERKYIIKMPSESILSAQNGYTVSKIVQIYLSSEADVTHRVRMRSFGDRVVYTETKKTRIDFISSHEEENEITEAEFCELSGKIKNGTRPVIKTRHTFVLDEVTFEIDVYPEWQNTAIMETELKSREETVKMPSFIEIVKDVTGDKNYSNASMAYAFPEELI